MAIDEKKIEEYVASNLAEFQAKLASKAAPKVEAPKKPEELLSKKATAASLSSGTTTFSKVFGAVPKNGDFPVTVYRTEELNEKVRAFVPHEDKDYVVQIEEAARLVAGIQDGDKTLITGPTGSGKSSLCAFVCAKLGLPFIRINMSGDVESSTLFGFLTAKDGSTVWVDGPVTEAVRYGAVLLIDEWELMPAEITMSMQNLFESDGYLYLKEMPGESEDKVIKPHIHTRIICAGNTVGQGDDNGSFTGVGVQNSATIDRFTNTLVLSYLDKKHEVGIITGKSAVSKETATKMVSLAQLVRTAYEKSQINLTMSPRTLINWGRKIERYKDVRVAFDVSFWDKLRESDKRVVNELFVKVFA